MFPVFKWSVFGSPQYFAWQLDKLLEFKLVYINIQNYETMGIHIMDIR